MAQGNEVANANDPNEEKTAPEEEEDEELEDPLDEIKEQCKQVAACQLLQQKIEECAQRVAEAPEDEAEPENCNEELYDFVHCVDKCISKSLFAKLK